jgi:two-component system, OmpR family, copper resistance phosphate regulon response regulator CusR
MNKSSSTDETTGFSGVQYGERDGWREKPGTSGLALNSARAIQGQIADLKGITGESDCGSVLLGTSPGFSASFFPRLSNLLSPSFVDGHTEPMRILVVEDEEKMAKALRKGLEAEQFSVNVAATGEEAFFLASTESYDLVILDWMLPQRDGLEVLAALRQKGVTVPVLMLTSKDTIRDRVHGLDAGADDYLVKPFAFPELLARIRALSRRGKLEWANTLRLADLEMDVEGRVVQREGRELTLTAREFDVLHYLLRNQGRVVSREMLARDVWQETTRYTPLDNVIDVHVAHLRRKIDEPFRIKLLHTVRGVGFVLREEIS